MNHIMNFPSRHMAAIVFWDENTREQALRVEDYLLSNGYRAILVNRDEDGVAKYFLSLPTPKHAVEVLVGSEFEPNRALSTKISDALLHVSQAGLTLFAPAIIGSLSKPVIEQTKSGHSPVGIISLERIQDCPRIINNAFPRLVITTTEVAASHWLYAHTDATLVLPSGPEPAFISRLVTLSTHVDKRKLCVFSPDDGSGNDFFSGLCNWLHSTDITHGSGLNISCHTTASHQEIIKRIGSPPQAAMVSSGMAIGFFGKPKVVHEPEVR